MIEFPIIDDADQSFSTIINSRRVSIRMRFNHTSERWSIDLSVDGEPVLHGRKVVPNIDLLDPFNFGVGVIFAFSETGAEPSRTQFIDGLVKLYAAGSVEVDAALAS